MMEDGEGRGENEGIPQGGDMRTPSFSVLLFSSAFFCLSVMLLFTSFHPVMPVRPLLVVVPASRSLPQKVAMFCRRHRPLEMGFLLWKLPSLSKHKNKTRLPS